MSVVKGTIKAKGKYVYAQCWVMRNGKHVTLTPQGVDLPGGKYELQWEFRADVGATINCTVNAPDVVTGKDCTTGDQTLAHGQSHIGSGGDKPPGYTAKIFKVS